MTDHSHTLHHHAHAHGHKHRPLRCASARLHERQAYMVATLSFARKPQELVPSTLSASPTGSPVGGLGEGGELLSTTAPAGVMVGLNRAVEGRLRVQTCGSRFPLVYPVFSPSSDQTLLTLFSLGALLFSVANCMKDTYSYRKQLNVEASRYRNQVNV